MFDIKERLRDVLKVLARHAVPFATISELKPIC
jgi:hypothetical protein